jgi:uncharacterized membrane protein (UPF0127 family)
MSRLFVLWLAVAVLAWACSPAVETGGELRVVTLQVARLSISAEVADTPAVMKRGLMFRDSLPADGGMLFVFGSPKRAGFWMRNTRIPLSIAYLDAEGRILEIHDMFPYDETLVSSYSSKVSYALEMNQGWFRRHEVTPGMSLQGIREHPLQK